MKILHITKHKQLNDFIKDQDHQTRQIIDRKLDAKILGIELFGPNQYLLSVKNSKGRLPILKVQGE